ncbi:Zn-ribbon domain-containing OB-fold protein [Lysinibacillus yapensis]|uniref:Zn-ribbon domain-containing OB-fold protein n=1 Tax=Ureibacillus yapensis TaxID=2304605 RepID=A0A396SCP3_9BACL|nr:Zn-ribbon domain-containing OB-fold protein [Lysinibacillus yapensis]RHW39390.1 Zn-ribbon domain-containing OB-fold protein [Lysinibacillus yapensis]
MGTIYQDRIMTIPEVHPEHKEYWDAAVEGKLLIKKCASCGEFHYYPRVICPHCHSDKTSWFEAKGTGHIYTYSVMRHGKPYAIAFVELDEGPRMMTNIVDCDLDEIRIDQKVKVVFKQSGNQENPGSFIACFTPIESD